MPDAIKLYDAAPEKHSPQPLPAAGFRGAMLPSGSNRG
jgi:hypothetical protein